MDCSRKTSTQFIGLLWVFIHFPGYVLVLLIIYQKESFKKNFVGVTLSQTGDCV